MPRITQVTPVILAGGLNLAVPSIALNAGECTQLFNYEVNTLGRYSRIEGFERFDGQPAPSETPTVVNIEQTDAENLEQWVANREVRRALIQPVEGSGPILGIAVYKGVVYAFRNTADGTAAKMWSSSATGWVEVATPALAPNGTYRFRVGNFTGSSSTIELWGCDGVNKLFRFDGATYTEVETPITGKEPQHLEILPSQVLVLAFEGGSILTSGVGLPTSFDPIDGGSEIAVADQVTGLDLQANNSLAVFCRHRTYVLYGSSVADFDLTSLSTETGAIPASVQTIGDSIYLDDRGLTRLDRVQSFGNFDMATLSQAVEPDLKKYINRVTASFAIKEKNQYRLCFDDGKGYILTFNGTEISGFSTFDYGMVIRCAVSAEDAQGKEVIFFGSDDGYVYQAEKGFSFDGQPYVSAMRPAFFSYSEVKELKKRFEKAIVEIETPNEADILITPDFEYSSDEIPPHSSKEVIAKGGGGYFDEAIWDETRWSAASQFTAEIEIDAIARNMSLFIRSESDRQPPHTLVSFITFWRPKNLRY